MGGRGSVSSADRANQARYKRENARAEAFVNQSLGKTNGSIEMENGQIIEHYSMREMTNYVLREIKGNGFIDEDQSIDIMYKDGTYAGYRGGDDTSTMKLTGIKGVIYGNPNTEAFAGSGIKLVNYGELYWNDSDDDWRLEFD